MKGVVFFGVAVWLVVTGLLLAAIDDYADQIRQVSFYCEMTELYTLSDGEFGWPDYKGTAHDCPPAR